MRRKKLWNKTLAAVLGLALMVGAPLVNLGNGQLFGGVTITVQAGHSTKNTGGTIIGQHWILTLSGTVTAEEIRTAINNWGFGSTNVRDYNIKEIVCEPGTVIVGDLVYSGKGMFEGFSGMTTADFSNATFTDTGNASQLFKGCSSLTTIDWGEFDLDGVTKADEMFSGCSSITTLDLSAWDTGDLTSTKSMFNGCSSLTTIYASETWQTASINSDTNMFYGCTNLKGGNGTKQSNSNVGKSYACFDLEGMPGYLTYRGDLEMQPEDAAGFTESGTEAYWADPDDDTVKYQLVNGIFTEVTDSDLVIPQILIEPHHEEVSADPNGVGTKEYWDGTDGNTYVWSEADNTYVIVSSQEALTIPQVQVILVNAVPATYTEAGHEAYYTDGNGHYYEKDSNDQYIERELDYFMTSALLGEHHEAAEAVPYEGGNAEYWESANEGMCYVSDGNGGYDEVSIESITQPAVGVKEAVPAKDPNYGTNGAGNVAYVVGSNDEIYVDDGTGHYVKTSLEAVTISALQLYMQADPINTQSAVDILIYAELPEGAIPEEYSVVFGGREVQFDSSFYSDSQGERLYKAMISAPAKNMATECSYSIKNGETVMFNGSQTTSIRKYALQVLNGDSSEAVKKCCRAMLAYGASAQILKNYDLENLASAGIEGEGLDYSGVELPDNFVFDKAGLNTVLENNDAPVRYYAMGLAMEAETRVNLAFLVTSGTQDDAVTFINENFSFGTKAVNAVKNGNTRYVVVTTDAIAIKDLLNDLSISYGGADYVINAQQYFTSAKSANIDIQNMCKALQNYYNYVAAKNN